MLKYLVILNLLINCKAINTININFYNSSDNCIINNHSILQYTNYINTNCRCLTNEVCKENMDLTKLFIMYNNTKIYLRDLTIGNKCTRYRNLFYNFNIKIENECILNLLIIVITILISIFILVCICKCNCINYDTNLIKFRGFKKYKNTPNYSSINL